MREPASLHAWRASRPYAQPVCSRPYAFPGGLQAGGRWTCFLLQTVDRTRTSTSEFFGETFRKYFAYSTPGRSSPRHRVGGCRGSRDGVESVLPLLVSRSYLRGRAGRSYL